MVGDAHQNDYCVLIVAWVSLEDLDSFAALLFLRLPIYSTSYPCTVETLIHHIGPLEAPIPK